jgi:hypothetical protein
METGEAAVVVVVVRDGGDGAGLSSTPSIESASI